MKDALTAYKETYEIARSTWDLASKKFVRTMNADDKLEMQAAFYWMTVARENVEKAGGTV